MKFKAQRLQLFDLEAEKHSYLTLWVFSKWNEYHCGKSWTCLLFWLKKTLEIPVRWEYLPFRATAAGPRCCSLTASRSLCRCISSASPRRFCRETERLSRCHRSWRSWAPSAPDPPHGPGQERADGWRPESLHIPVSSYTWLWNHRPLDLEPHTPWKDLSYKVLKICYFLLYCLSLESLRRTKYHCYTTNQEPEVSQSDALKCAGAWSFTDEENRAHLDVLVLCVDWWVLQYCV